MSDKSISQVTSHISTVKEIKNAWSETKKWYLSKVQWSVTIHSRDRLFEKVKRWFTEEVVDSTQPPRALEAVYRAVTNYSRSATTVKFMYDEQKPRVVTIDGHEVKVSLVKDNSDEGELASRLVDAMPEARKETLRFTAKNHEGQIAVTNLLRKIADSKDTKPALHMVGSWGDWQTRDDLPARSMKSVVLRENQMEKLSHDLDNFLSSEEDYNKLGMPWHRGYLLHGPPGTGKTSIVKALATEKNLDLWYISLGDLDKDSKLLTLISGVTARSILLLEDIDVFHSAKNREDENGKASLAALLNALDGVSTPHGMITFMTTNDVSALDSALTRPGRIDVTEEIKLPDEYQVKKLFSNFYGVEATQPITLVDNQPTAYYTELFRRCSNNPEFALEALGA